MTNRWLVDGGTEGIWTLNHLSANQALSQLELPPHVVETSEVESAFLGGTTSKLFPNLPPYMWVLITQVRSLLRWVEPVAMLRGVEPRSTERQSAIICRYTIASFNLHKAQKKIYTESNRNPCLLDKCSTNELFNILKRNIAVCAFGAQSGTWTHTPSLAAAFETAMSTIPSFAHMVRDTGLEPARVSSTGPKPAAYAIRLIPHIIVVIGSAYL